MHPSIMLISEEPPLSVHFPLPRGWPRNRSSTVVLWPCPVTNKDAWFYSLKQKIRKITVVLFFTGITDFSMKIWKSKLPSNTGKQPVVQLIYKYINNPNKKILHTTVLRAKRNGAPILMFQFDPFCFKTSNN